MGILALLIMVKKVLTKEKGQDFFCIAHTFNSWLPVQFDTALAHGGFGARFQSPFIFSLDNKSYVSYNKLRIV